MEQKKSACPDCRNCDKCSWCPGAALAQQTEGDE